MKISAFLPLLAALALLPAKPLIAHGGGLAADGCHNDRKNGGRHCHGGGSSPAPKRLRAFGGGGSGTYYANCAAARAAGAAPVMAGEPGYSSRLDRDGDGIGCE